MKRTLSTCLMAVFLATLAISSACGQDPSSQTDQQVPERKQTTLGLYVTAEEAYEAWRADPENVTIIDVRTPEEFIFIGHPSMAWNIPFAIQTYEWNPEMKAFAMQPNAAFVSQVAELFEPDATLMLMCRSGDRSARAVDLLAEAGFTNAYTIVDGMEGDMVKDPDSAYYGKRMENGWKNSGSPWTYKIDPERVQLPEGP